jgi:aminoglycoside 6-adenylyltransferase
MPAVPVESDVLGELIAWGESEDDVRAVVLTSSRARRDGSADELSDYDVIVAVRDAERFVAENGWAGARGGALAVWGDEHLVHGVETYFRGAVYADGVKIDFTVWPGPLLERVASGDELTDDLDVGYRVLLDKDGGTSAWRPPTYRAHIPTRPTQRELDALVEEFWWDTTYVAKALWRGEVVFAKFVLDYDAKLTALRRMLEWRLEVDHGWALRPGAYGRGLERLLPTDVLEALSRTYVGTDVEENWNALFETTALFRRVANEVADALGHRYPTEVDEGVTALLEAVRNRSPKQ